MEKKAEMRMVPRKPYSQPVEFELKRIQPSTMESIRGRGGIFDISTKGLGLITDIPLKAGEILKLHLPSYPKGISLPILSEVRWAKPEENSFKVGLQFIS